MRSPAVAPCHFPQWFPDGRRPVPFQRRVRLWAAAAGRPGPGPGGDRRRGGGGGPQRDRDGGGPRPAGEAAPVCGWRASPTSGGLALPLGGRGSTRSYDPRACPRPHPTGLFRAAGWIAGPRRRRGRGGGRGPGRHPGPGPGPGRRPRGGPPRAPRPSPSPSPCCRPSGTPSPPASSSSPRCPLPPPPRFCPANGMEMREHAGGGRTGDANP